jgi:transcription antitermination factor NusG
MNVTSVVETNSQSAISCGSVPANQHFPQQLQRGHRWYCWKAKPGEQFRALRELSAQGFNAYLPLYVEKRDAPPKPLFGAYGFVPFDRNSAQWRVIHSTRGIAHLVCIDHTKPVPVPVGIVEALQARGRPGDGVIDETYQGPEHPDLTGKMVRVTSGPFADLHGICRWSNQKRIAVLLEVMGRPVEISIQRQDVTGA